jgi:hypothetical protein
MFELIADDHFAVSHRHFRLGFAYSRHKMQKSQREANRFG